MIESITETSEVRSRSGKTFYVGLLIALLITAGVGVGMMLLQRRNATRLAEKQKAAEQTVEKPKPKPELQVLLDESIVKAGKASVSGTVKNLSPNPVAGVSLELQLIQRKDGSTVVRSIDPAPADLAPNGEAKFSMTVSQHDFRTWRVSRVVSHTGNREIAFVTDDGVARPKEGPMTGTQTVAGRGSGSRTDGGFINTPDTPERVP
jgi:hypothetical protein